MTLHNRPHYAVKKLDKIQTNKQTNKQINKQINKQTNKQKQQQTNMTKVLSLSFRRPCPFANCDHWMRNYISHFKTHGVTLKENPEL